MRLGFIFIKRTKCTKKINKTVKKLVKQEKRLVKR